MTGNIHMYTQYLQLRESVCESDFVFLTPTAGEETHEFSPLITLPLPIHTPPSYC